MRTRVRLFGIASLAAVLFSGCGSSSTSDARPVDGADKGHGGEVARAQERQLVPTPAIATVTFHVKEMGLRLNLL